MATTATRPASAITFGPLCNSCTTLATPLLDQDPQAPIRGPRASLANARRYARRHQQRLLIIEDTRPLGAYCVLCWTRSTFGHKLATTN